MLIGKLEIQFEGLDPEMEKMITDVFQRGLIELETDPTRKEPVHLRAYKEGDLLGTTIVHPIDRMDFYGWMLKDFPKNGPYRPKFVHSDDGLLNYLEIESKRDCRRFCIQKL